MPGPYAEPDDVSWGSPFHESLLVSSGPRVPPPRPRTVPDPSQTRITSCPRCSDTGVHYHVNSHTPGGTDQTSALSVAGAAPPSTAASVRSTSIAWSAGW